MSGVPDDYRVVLRRVYDELIDFVMNEPFKGLIEKMYSLSYGDRPSFVRDFILSGEY